MTETTEVTDTTGLAVDPASVAEIVGRVEQELHDNTQTTKRVEANTAGLITAVEGRVGTLETALADNTASTRRVEANTAELVEAFGNLQSALKVINWIASAIKPFGYIAAAMGAMIGLYTAYKAGGGR